MPRDDRRCRKSLCARLWPHHGVPLRQRHGHSARCRHRVFRRGGYAVLRFAVGESDRPRPAVQRRCHADGTLPARIPRARRENESAVFDEPGHAPDVSRRAMHDDVYRRHARTVSHGGAARSGQQAAAIPWRDHRQRQSAGERSSQKHAPRTGAVCGIRHRATNAGRNAAKVQGVGAREIRQLDSRPRNGCC